MPNVFPITITKEGVSDDFYIINELYLENGSKVQKGDLIFCFETSKTSIDMEAPSDGYIFYDIEEGSEVIIGQIIAIVSNQKDFSYQDWFLFKNTKEDKILRDMKNEIKISKPAQRLIDSNQIDLSVFKDFTLVTKEDVENYLSNLVLDSQEVEIPLIDINTVVIYGGGGHAKTCIDVIKQTKSHTIIGIIDDNIKPNTKILDVPVLGKADVLNTLIESGLQNIVLGIGGVISKEFRVTKFINFKRQNLLVPTIIHPSASLEPSVSLGEGNQIMQGAILGSNVSVGDNCIINSGCIVSHDTVIGNNVHIAPGAIIGGGVTIKDNTIIGMGCTIFLGLRIGENVVIQNGVHIFNNIDNNKIVKNNNE